MIFKLSTAVVFLGYVAVLAPVKAAPTLIARHEGHDDSSSAGASSTATGFAQQNAIDAQKLNARFKTIKATDSCTSGYLGYRCFYPIELTYPLPSIQIMKWPVLMEDLPSV